MTDIEYGNGQSLTRPVCPECQDVAKLKGACYSSGQLTVLPKTPKPKEDP